MVVETLICYFELLMIAEMLQQRRQASVLKMSLVVTACTCITSFVKTSTQVLC